LISQEEGLLIDGEDFKEILCTVNKTNIREE
jgi:hypothetical protein